MSIFKNLLDYLNPGPDQALQSVAAHWQQHLPTLWLLGKTCAGKSSLIQAVTGHSQIEIGNGFSPCTQTADSYAFPSDKPLLRFLDTRGLGEADYDASEDIQACQQQSHALIVVMSAAEAEQSAVLKALQQIQKSAVFEHLLLVVTNVLSVSAEERQQIVTHHQAQVSSVWRQAFKTVEVDFAPDSAPPLGIETLQDALCEMLPMLNVVMSKQQHGSQEEQNFAALKTEVLWYAGSAAASDTVPAVGLVSVPAIQAKMLHSLANRYGIEWDKRLMAEFIGTLGTGFGVQYAGKLGLRELAKLIPVYGQTVGAAAAAALSFASTYAIGRVACKYLYHKRQGELPPTEDMQDLYKNAFKSVRGAVNNDA